MHSIRLFKKASDMACDWKRWQTATSVMEKRMWIYSYLLPPVTNHHNSCKFAYEMLFLINHGAMKF